MVCGVSVPLCEVYTCVCVRESACVYTPCVVECLLLFIVGVILQFNVLTLTATAAIHLLMLLVMVT